jgi:enterochelin esterase family protein
VGTRVDGGVTMRPLTVLAFALALTHPGSAQEASPRASRGSLAPVVIPSVTYPGGRRAWVYTPTGYPASCRGACNVIVAFDGADYRDTMPLPAILDSLVAAGRTPPAVAVLIDNGDGGARIADLGNVRKFSRFVGEEMLPWLRAHYAVARDAAHTLVTGSSAGGLAAAYVATQYPGSFGNVLSQSGAFWRGNEASNEAPYEWLTQHLASSPRVNVRFFLDVGALETRGALGGAAPSILDANRHLRSALVSKGYAVQYFEVPNGVHAPLTWRTRLPVGIVALLPTPAAR